MTDLFVERPKKRVNKFAAYSLKALWRVSSARVRVPRSISFLTNCPDFLPD